MSHQSPSRTVIALFAVAAFAAVAVAAAGCASKPEVIPFSGPRPPTRPDEVKVYQDPPQKYEMLGPVSVAITPETRWDERGDATEGFRRLRSAAAAKGANGILLNAQPGTYDYRATAEDRGAYYQVPIRKQPHAAIAEAIFVHEETDEQKKK